MRRKVEDIYMDLGILLHGKQLNKKLPRQIELPRRPLGPNMKQRSFTRKVNHD